MDCENQLKKDLVSLNVLQTLTMMEVTIVFPALTKTAPTVKMLVEVQHALTASLVDLERLRLP